MENLLAIYENAKNGKIEQLISSTKMAIINAIKATGRSTLYLQNKTNDEWYYYDNSDDLIVTNYLNHVISSNDFSELLRKDNFFNGWIVRYIGDNMILIEKDN